MLILRGQQSIGTLSKMTINNGENHKISSTTIIFNWKLMFCGGSTVVMGQMEGRLGFWSLSVNSVQ